MKEFISQTPNLPSCKKDILKRRDFQDLFPELLGKTRKDYPLSLLLLKIELCDYKEDSLTPLAWGRVIDIAGKAILEKTPSEIIIGIWEHDTYALLLPGYTQEEVHLLNNELEYAIHKHLEKANLAWTREDFFIISAIESAPPANYCTLGRSAQQELQHRCGKIFPANFKENYNNKLLDGFLEALLNTNDSYLARQGAIAGEFALSFANKLNLETETTSNIAVAARLEDLGMLLAAGNLVWKPGVLTIAERKNIVDHPRFAADIGKKIGLPPKLVRGILHHHEAWDGSGYPFGLYGEQIPLEGRILAFSSLWAALLLPRPYRRAFSREEALGELRKISGSILQPALIDVAEEINKERTILVFNQYKQPKAKKSY